MIQARIKARSGDERTFAKLYAEAGRATIDTTLDTRSQAGLALGLLDGIIVSIKDLFDVTDKSMLACSVMSYATEQARDDASMVKRLRRAGEFIICKTHMAKFAFTALGLNPHAVDPTLIPRRCLVECSCLGRRRQPRYFDRFRHRRFGACASRAQSCHRFQVDSAAYPA